MRPLLANSFNALINYVVGLVRSATESQNYREAFSSSHDVAIPIDPKTSITVVACSEDRICVYRRQSVA
jgi:hypothetical protein